MQNDVLVGRLYPKWCAHHFTLKCLILFHKLSSHLLQFVTVCGTICIIFKNIDITRFNKHYRVTDSTPLCAPQAFRRPWVTGRDSLQETDIVMYNTQRNNWRYRTSCLMHWLGLVESVGVKVQLSEQYLRDVRNMVYVRNVRGTQDMCIRQGECCRGILSCSLTWRK